jgi:putative spermidine/putrescine transport system permease protein
VIIAMTHILLPYMVIPLVAALRTLDPSQLRAAMMLGARPRIVLRRVVWPLSLPGLAAGTVIVFVMALGFYVTPALMGGRGQITLAMLLDTEINEQLNWGYAAAHALVLLLTTLAILVVYNRRFGLARLWGGIQ